MTGKNKCHNETLFTLSFCVRLVLDSLDRLGQQFGLASLRRLSNVRYYTWRRLRHSNENEIEREPISPLTDITHKISAAAFPQRKQQNDPRLPWPKPSELWRKLLHEIQYAETTIFSNVGVPSCVPGSPRLVRWDIILGRGVCASQLQVFSWHRLEDWNGRIVFWKRRCRWNHCPSNHCQGRCARWILPILRAKWGAFHVGYLEFLSAMATMDWIALTNQSSSNWVHTFLRASRSFVACYRVEGFVDWQVPWHHQMTQIRLKFTSRWVDAKMIDVYMSWIQYLIWITRNCFGQGKRKMVDGFVRWCGKGDVGLSQVVRVEEVIEADPTGLYDGFYVKTK